MIFRSGCRTTNVDVLNQIIDVQIGSLDREQSAGTFSVDLLGEDQSGNTVVIENQLGKSDHDHLGKLITYLTAFDAKTAIWIVAEARPEHIAAVTWLNESSNTSFYFLKIEAIQIGESEPAPLLTKIVGPSQEGREVGKAEKEISERHSQRYQFWEQLLDVDLHVQLNHLKMYLHQIFAPIYHRSTTICSIC